VKKLASKKSTKQSGHYIFKKTELLHLVKKMKRTGVKLHSLRRGGILEMYNQDIPVEKIRELTLHTSNEALLEYIDVRRCPHPR
jgi:hypothetical protein